VFMVTAQMCHCLTVYCPSELKWLARAMHRVGLTHVSRSKAKEDLIYGQVKESTSRTTSFS